MRTTITLDPDVESLVKNLMATRGLSFKEAVNAALREALATARPGAPHGFTPVHMGAPKVPLEHALRLAAELEDEDFVRKLASGR